MRLRAIQTPVDGTVACLARLLRRGRHAAAGAGSEEHFGGLKYWPTSYEAAPRPQASCVGAAARLARSLRILDAFCGKGRHAVAGAWSDGPLGGLKSWPTSHDATPRSPYTCGRHGSAPCTLTACLARLLRVWHAYSGKRRHAAAGAWAEGPLGGLKSWPTSHEATPRPKQTCVGAAACLERLLRQGAPCRCRRLV